MKTVEANFDGIVGPTHNYAGLSVGNVASLNNAKNVSNPKEAAKQGLAKMKALHDLGLTQGILAPQSRPDIAMLRRIGFSGTNEQVISKAHREAPIILACCYSASSMWTANAATVSPSMDSNDNLVHFTPANLSNKFHRHLEPKTTGRILKSVFNNDQYFTHHLHLPSNDHFGDEGAANHTRICSDYGTKGVQIFAFGRHAFDNQKIAPKKYPARQTFESVAALQRLHQLNDEQVVLIQQNPEVIDSGVFHNDVIAVGNKNVLFYHEMAFLGGDQVTNEIKEKAGFEDIHFIKVSNDEIAVAEAVKTYLFNTQLIETDEGMAIIAPIECEESPTVSSYLKKLVSMDNPVKKVHYYNLRQSMKNGGGPACLRLRVALNENEVSAVNSECLINENKWKTLNSWVDKHYRDRLSFEDLRDPKLILESRTALDELTQILDLGAVYDFQQV